MGELFDTAFLKKLETLSLRARQMMTPKTLSAGEHRSNRHGSSVEFADYRQYTPGDDFRRIDWNAYARFENLFLKLFRQEQELNLEIICDGSASMGFGNPDKFDYSRRLAAAIAFVGLNTAARVNVHLTGGEVSENFPGSMSGHRRSRSAVFDIFRMLEGASTSNRADLFTTASKIVSKRSGGGIVVIISDMLSFERPDKVLKLLAYEKFQPMLLHVMSPQEVTPDLSGDLRLVDCETSHQVEVSPSTALLKAYSKRLEKFRQIIRDATVTAGGEYLFVSTDIELETLVLDWMRRASIIV